MDVNTFCGVLFSFPVYFFSVPFLFFTFIMVVDFIFDFVDSMVGNVDIFASDISLNGFLLLPPILSKAPLAILLCLSFFFATVISFYTNLYVVNLSSDHIILALQLLSIPVIAFVALHLVALILKPLSSLFNNNNAFAQLDITGMKGEVCSRQVDNKFGEVRVICQGNELLVNAITGDDEIITYGDQVYILTKNPDSDAYIVTKV